LTTAKSLWFLASLSLLALLRVHRGNPILVGKGIAQAAEFDAAAGAHGGAVALPVHEPKLEPIAGEHEEIEDHEVPPSAKNEASHEDHELIQKAADVPPLLAAKPEKKKTNWNLSPWALRKRTGTA
jgi:hypothetical protein